MIQHASPQEPRSGWSQSWSLWRLRFGSAGCEERADHEHAHASSRHRQLVLTKLAEYDEGDYLRGEQPLKLANMLEDEWVACMTLF